MKVDITSHVGCECENLLSYLCSKTIKTLAWWLLLLAPCFKFKRSTQISFLTARWGLRCISICAESQHNNPKLSCRDGEAFILMFAVPDFPFSNIFLANNFSPIREASLSWWKWIVPCHNDGLKKWHQHLTSCAHPLETELPSALINFTFQSSGCELSTKLSSRSFNFNFLIILCQKSDALCLGDGSNLINVYGMSRLYFFLCLGDLLRVVG